MDHGMLSVHQSPPESTGKEPGREETCFDIDCELGKRHPRDCLEDCWKPGLGLEDEIEAHKERSLQ